MPIIGKTDASSLEEKNIDLQVIYRLWKGEPKQQLFNDDGTPRLNKAGKQMELAGADLEDKFRFEGSDRAVEQFLKVYGTLYPTQVRIFLPYPTVDQCFETWMEKYTFGSLQHRCNGERIIQKKSRKEYEVGGKKRFTWVRENVDLPCVKLEKGLDVCPECGKTGKGRLFFYVADLYAAGMGSTKCGMLAVNSEHDLATLSANLHRLQQKYGCLHASPIPSPWTYGYIPYILTRERKQIMKAAGESQVQGETWVVSISEDPVWLECLQRWQQAQEIKQLQGASEDVRQLLSANLSASRPALAGGVTVEAIASEVASTAAEPVVDNWRTPIYLEIESHMKRLGWKGKDAVKYMKEAFGGKTNRDQLTDEELTAFKLDIASFVKPPEEPESIPVQAEIL